MNIRGKQITYNSITNILQFEGLSVPVEPVNNKINFRIIVDKCSIEIFCNTGEKAIFLPVSLDNQDRTFKFIVHKGKIKIESLEMYSLEPIWNSAC